jgi:4-carboxymuconolactone decarboxylase
VAHARIARAEGLPDDVIERVRTRGDLAALPSRYARPVRVVQHVLAFESLPKGLQDQVQGELGITGLMELVVLVGHYRLIGGVLSAFDTPLPAGTPAPF